MSIRFIRVKPQLFDIEPDRVPIERDKSPFMQFKPHEGGFYLLFI